MSNPKKQSDTSTPKASSRAIGWEIHFGLTHGSILTREELIAKAPSKWKTEEQETGFADEKTLPHGMLYLSIDDALKVCLQTGHPDTHYAMIVGWYWDSFEEQEIIEGTFSTPEWDEIDEGESLFAEDEHMNGFPCWNSDIYDRFEDHSRQGYMGIIFTGDAPKYDLMGELWAIKKLALELADPASCIMQDRDEQQWALYFRTCRFQRLLAGHRINPIA